MLTNRQKALIHVARQQTGMSEEEYRALLSRFGAQSSKELTAASFDAAMAHFEKLGFAARGKKETASSRVRLRGKVRAILTDMKLTESYADAIARSRFGVDAWSWLTADDLYKLVAMLTYHQRRHPERTGHG